MVIKFRESVGFQRLSHVGGKAVIPHRPQGFSLVELLVVMLVAALLLGLTVSTIGLTQTKGRDAAVGHFSGYLEMARSEALRSGRPTALAIHEDPANGTTSTGIFQMQGLPREASITPLPIGEWRLLDKQIVLGTQEIVGGSNLLIQGTAVAPIWPGDLPRPWLFRTKNGQDIALPAIVFNERGQVVFPLSEKPIDIIISEGFWENGGKQLLGGASSPPEKRTTVLRLGRTTGKPKVLESIPTP